MIYIVDDDEAVRFALSMLVEGCGWQARPYATAEAFLDSYRDNSDSNCLILDLNMPGMSGADLLDKLKTTSHWLPVIVVTGFADSELAVRARRAGVRAVLRKPFNDQVLLGHVRHALGLAQA